MAGDKKVKVFPNYLKKESFFLKKLINLLKKLTKFNKVLDLNY